MVLIIAVYSAGDTILGDTLLDTAFIGTYKLILRSIVFVMLIQGIASYLNLLTINCNL